MITPQMIREAAYEMLDDLVLEFSNRGFINKESCIEYDNRSKAIKQWANDLIEAIS